MKRKSLICVMLAALLALGCAGCSLSAAGEAAENVAQALDGIVTDARQVLEQPASQPQAQPPETADPPAPVDIPTAPDEAETPAPEPEEPPAGEITVPPESPEEAPAPEEPAEPSGAPRPGKYKGEDGSVLTVKDDGSCTYKTSIEITVNGQRMADTVTFHGSVSDGTFTFDKVTYYGMDITDMAREAGYEDASQWEAQAAALYGK